MIARKFKSRFAHSSLRNRLQKKLKEQAVQPYVWAERNNISQTAVYRLLSNHNLSPANYEKVKKALVCLLLLIISSSCHHLENGRVVGHIHEPESTYIYYTYIPCGKSMIPIAHTGIDSEDFILTVKGFYNGDSITEEFYVSEYQFNKYKQGDLFCTKGCSQEDNNNIEND